MGDSDRPERPGPDATAAEIMEWMEADFSAAVVEGVKEGMRRKEADDGADTDKEATDD